jgi:hypothetical protein
MAWHLVEIWAACVHLACGTACVHDAFLCCCLEHQSINKLVRQGPKSQGRPIHGYGQLPDIARILRHCRCVGVDDAGAMYSAGQQETALMVMFGRKYLAALGLVLGLIATAVHAEGVTLEETDAVLQPLIGTYVFNDVHTQLYKADVKDWEMSDQFEKTIKRDVLVENLTKLKIISYKYIYTPRGVAVRVSDPKGDEHVVYGELGYAGLSNTENPLDRLNLNLMQRIPKKLSKRDIALIRSGTVRVGMSEEALFMTMGYPDHVNTASYGNQIVFGNTYVYVTNGKVTAWQQTGN